jgi:mRNA interferase RelE/StbE
MNVSYSKCSLKRLSRLEKDVRSNIITAIEKLPDTGDIKKMHGRILRNLYRLRVGKYRVLFVHEDQNIKIIDIDTRGDIYK